MDGILVKSYNRSRNNLPHHDLTDIQLDAYQYLVDHGLAQVFKDISPIRSSDNRYSIHFPDSSEITEKHGPSFRLDPPTTTMQECLEKGMTYSSAIIADVIMRDNIGGSVWTSKMYFGEMPRMTPYGSFIISGTEKIVITQLVKSPGIYYSIDSSASWGIKSQRAKIIPDKGTYLEIYSKDDGCLYIRYDRRLDIPFTAFLRILSFADDGFSNTPFHDCSDRELFEVFRMECGRDSEKYVTQSLSAEKHLYAILCKNSAAEWFFQKNRQKGDIPEIRRYISRRFYDLAAYDLTTTGRRQLNKRLGLEGTIPENHRTLTVLDMVKAVSEVIRCQESGCFIKDDIDHLSNRRTRSCGELIQRAFTDGMRDMERQTINRLNFILDPKEIRCVEDYLDTAPVGYAVRSFFAGSELCQFMDQNNPLSELRHKRTISALGPNGIDNSRAGFDVRDIHHTHYGRLCPIETPEGKNSGLISRLSIYARRNSYGFLETPYRIVSRKVHFTPGDVLNRIPIDDVYGSNGQIIFRAGIRITHDIVKQTDFTDPAITEFDVVPFITDEIIYIDAEQEDKYTIALSTAGLNEYGEFTEKRISCRHFPDFLTCSPGSVDLQDISPQQAVGISAGCIPFLEHDDGHRAMMGTNMLSQAVPLLYPEIPLVMTGMERYAALDSAQMRRASENGTVVRADSGEIELLTGNNIIKRLCLRKFMRTNHATCCNQKPAVVSGQTVKKGDILADAACTEGGILALGHNPVVAFLCWDGYNFEDAIVVSERLIQEDKYTSLDIIQFEAKASYTEAGVEEITRIIPDTDPANLMLLDSHGIAKVGTMLHGGDVIIGKVSPRRENDADEELPEEFLVKAISGRKANRFKDTSVRLPHYMQARVIDARILSHEDIPDMDTMTDLIVRVTVAKKRKLEAGDKMSGRHGNKGVVARIVPVEDMPYMEDGTPVDIILNPLGVPGRMNVGQILEVWLGWAAYRLGIRCETPVFDSATVHDIEAELARAWLYDQSYEDFRNEAWDEMIRMKSEAPETVYDPYSLSRNTILYRVRHYSEYFSEKEEDIVMEYAKICFGPERIHYRSLKEMIACRWIERADFSSEGVFLWDSIPGNVSAVYPENSAAITVCLKIWLMRMGYTGQLPEDEDSLRKTAEEWSAETHEPLPITGKQWLWDGRTGERYDHPVNVGVMNMIKLHHLAEDKVQARSTGPYSMITQQPLGGKINKGGQRIGEMEVWALEAYGCANLLHEMLTIKSDDTEGRKQANWNMLRGLPVEYSDVPASFRVLVHELMGLGLTVSAFSDNGDVTFPGLENNICKDMSGIQDQYPDSDAGA